MRIRRKPFSCSGLPLPGRKRSLSQKSPQVIADLGVAERRDPLLPNHHGIGGVREPGLVQAEELSNPSFHMIPLDGLPDLAADDDPQTGPPFPVRADEEQKVAGRKAPSPAGDGKIFRSLEQPIFLGKRLVRTLGVRSIRRMAHRVFTSPVEAGGLAEGLAGPVEAPSPGWGTRDRRGF